jgi:hypothetical protein
MKTFDVQSIAIDAPFEKVFGYIAETRNLPAWTSAFEAVFDGRASMRTPNGTVEVALTVKASAEAGTVDWIMKFPNGDTATACSRVVPAGKARSIYSFILLAPPVPLEQLEGALEQQSQTLREELAKLRAILSESH